MKITRATGHTDTGAHTHPLKLFTLPEQDSEGALADMSDTIEPVDSNLADLPDEVVWMFFTHVELYEVAFLAAVSHRFSDILHREAESIWRSHACARLELDVDTCGVPMDTCGGAECETSWRNVLQAHWVRPPASLETSAGQPSLETMGLSARFVGRLGRDRAIRADAPLPLAAPFVAVQASPVPAGELPSEKVPTPRVVLADTAYFEVAVSNAPTYEGEPLAPFHAEPCVSVGISTAAFPLTSKQCGWDRHSLGYHGDDGVIYTCNGVGVRHFGPRFGADDVVGCGLHLPTMQCFYALNGRFLGPAFAVQPRPAQRRALAAAAVGETTADMAAEAAVAAAADAAVAPPPGRVQLHNLFATVGIDSHQTVSLSFGRERPFALDVLSASRALARWPPPPDVRLALRVLHVAAEPLAPDVATLVQQVLQEDSDDDGENSVGSYDHASGEVETDEDEEEEDEITNEDGMSNLNAG